MARGGWAGPRPVHPWVWCPSRGVAIRALGGNTHAGAAGPAHYTRLLSRHSVTGTVWGSWGLGF